MIISPMIGLTRMQFRKMVLHERAIGICICIYMHMYLYVHACMYILIHAHMMLIKSTGLLANSPEFKQ